MYCNLGNDPQQTKRKQGVCDIVALPFTLKSTEGKRRIMKIQIFDHAKI
jgi:hypothetical protein